MIEKNKSKSLVSTRVHTVRGLDGSRLQVKVYADGTVDISPIRRPGDVFFVTLSQSGLARLAAVIWSIREEFGEMYSDGMD